MTGQGDAVGAVDRAGAAAGAGAVALFLVGGAVIGPEPSFGSPAPEVAQFFEEAQARIQLGAAIEALWAPLLLWFLVTVVRLAHAKNPKEAGLAVVALACGCAFVTLFLVDVTALAVGALRPENMASNPELAAALRDTSWLAQGMAAPLGCAMLSALGLLTIRSPIVWPRWVGFLALAAATAYSLRIGILFKDTGLFAADGVLGLWLPVAAIALWLTVASVHLGWRLHARAVIGR